MNYSMERLSTHCSRPRSSSKPGDESTTPSGHTVHWAIVRLHRKASFGWTKGQQCTKIQTELPNRGTPLRDRLRAVEYPSDVINQIGGWATEGAGQGYGERYDLKVCMKWMNLISA